MSIPSEKNNVPNPTILLVDDSRLNRELLRLNLSKHSYNFLTAQNGREAIEVVTANPEVDLILLDLMMPEMDGFDFLLWRKDYPEAQAIPVIVNSSLDDFESITRALTMNTYDYFTKPLQPYDLETALPLKIRNAVNSRRMVAEIQRQNVTMRNDLEMAARYQKFLLPTRADIRGAKIDFLFQPCYDVGGDYFDFIELPSGKVGFVLADVTGHGVAAAMTASIVKALLPGYLERYNSPAKGFLALNDDLLRLTQQDVFVTAVSALFDPEKSTLSWCLAGHPSPIYVRNGTPHPLVMPAPFLGIFDSDSPIMDLQDQIEEVKPGDRFFIYTDGLTEAPSSKTGEQFGLERVQEVLSQNVDKSLPDLRGILWQELNQHVQGDFPDDVAFIMAEF